MGRMSTWGNPLVVSKSTQLKAWVSPGRQVAFTVYEGSGWDEPSGQAIHVPQISIRIYRRNVRDYPRRNFLIISLRIFRRNKGEIPCGYFPLFSLENHRGYFHTEISLIFPSKCQCVIIAHTNGPSWEKISKWCFNANSLVNWNIYRFGEISLWFQPAILGEI